MRIKNRRKKREKIFQKKRKVKNKRAIKWFMNLKMKICVPHQGKYVIFKVKIYKHVGFLVPSVFVTKP